MVIDIISIFPDVFKTYFGESIIKIAQQKGEVKICLRNLRDYTLDKHRKVDDRPFGGGAGMVMTPEPIFRAVEGVMRHGSWVMRQKDARRKTHDARRTTRIILLSPQGKKLDHNLAKRLVRYEHLILICGRYEGVDERVRKFLVDEEVSIGDYILTGGELAAMVLVDAVVRLIPGVLGDEESVKNESFSDDLLEYPQYTRPADFRGFKTPKVLLSGNHSKIARWRSEQALKITRKKRPDLVAKEGGIR